jgi:hypothetical protein
MLFTIILIQKRDGRNITFTPTLGRPRGITHAAARPVPHVQRTPIG